MKAVVIREYGGRETLRMEELPLPSIEEDEVLIRVHAAGVNPVDWMVRSGFLKGMLDYEFPLILGWDVSGVVERAGSSVTGLSPGDEVFALPDIQRNGAYAQFVAVKAGTVALKPASVDHLQAASIPLAALTAWQALFDAADLQPGQSVLVHAAAGGVGCFAVQLAKWRGAQVTGTASSVNEEFLLDLGADLVIDYSRTPFEERVRGVDVVLDSMGGEVRERSWGVLREGGVLVSIVGPPDEARAVASGVRARSVFVVPDAGQLTTIAGLVDTGVVRPCVTRVLPLEEAARAHEMSETRHTRGKIVLKVP
ncbi:MAG: NADP-dependent oxidoreductase [bacterium]|nr:MAG: NADP-dependent oxidoreductase [bacterium]